MNKIEVLREDNNVRLKIIGAFDEQSKMPTDIDCDQLYVDFEGLTVFNSAGIRTWMNWTQQLKNVNKLFLENCRYKFIDQARYVNGILPANAEVLSFYVPFYNPTTDRSVEVKVTKGIEYSDGKINLPQPVDENGEPLEIDVDQKYFFFLK